MKTKTKSGTYRDANLPVDASHVRQGNKRKFMARLKNKARREERAKLKESTRDSSNE